MIKGKDIILRAPEMHDVDLLYRWENDQSLWHLSNTLSPFSHFTLEQYVLQATNDIFSQRQVRFMIEKDKKTVGCIDLFDFDPNNQRAGIGILIDKEYRNQHLASSALDCLLDYCFNTLNLHQVFCSISSENKDSLHLFQNKKFEICGTKQDWIRLNDKWIDEYQLQLLKKNYCNELNTNRKTEKK